MRATRMMMLVPAAMLAAACSRGSANPASDALSNDLALASQASPYAPQQFMGPNEMGYGQAPGYNGYAPQPYGQYPQPYSPYGQVQRQPVYASAPAARRTSTRSSSSGTVYREPVRHTKRDAVIGAGAGAVIGAVSSRDKVKGAIIGAAAGGILGGILGHTIDVDH